MMLTASVGEECAPAEVAQRRIWFAPLKPPPPTAVTGVTPSFYGKPAMIVRHGRIAQLALLVCGLTPLLAFAEDWPVWRGPHANGHSAESGLPVRWDARSVLWKAALPGIGQSSPVLVGERIFLTAALEQGKTRVVFALDRRDGKLLWQHEAWSGVPEPSHKMNGWASSTCVTDGERVIAFFGKGGIHCYGVDGKVLWSRDLGAFLGPWGTSACPILVGDVVIQNCDALENAFLIALDKKTGKTVWQTPRPTPERGGWSTPVLIQSGDRRELVLNGETAVRGYDPANGKELWWCKSFAGRGEPTVAPGKQSVFVVNGLAGDIYAVRTGGTGNVTKTHMAWHTPRKGGRDQPSPIVVGNHLIVADMTGITTCYEADTGKVLWKDRLRGSFTASPIAAGGLVYFLSEAGETFVLEPGPTMKVVAENAVGAKNEMFRASPAASGGQIFLRSQTHLYCIGKK
jgi:outer membrane protein assembly factor BamB